MNRKRIIAIGKLVLLFGTPLAVILGLFSCGVYCGSGHRDGITRFERDFLGLDVEVPGQPAKAEVPTETKAPEAKAPAEAKTPPETKSPPETKAEPIPPVVVPPSASGGVPAPLPPPTTRVDPLDDALAARLRASAVVRVKVLVDPPFVDEHADWIDYVQRTVSRASQVYEQQLGISLELASVGRWAVPPEGMGTSELLADLREHPREGADVVLGLTARPFDGAATTAEVPAPGDPFNGTHAVVYATDGHRDAHLRTLLHEVAHLFGATDVVDPADPAHVAGSWMSYAVVTEAQAQWIDPANRQRILERKQLPFAAEAPPTPAEDEAAAEP